MAVVQISKIQLRRGRKLTTGLPQLASGELAWAIDTQELYVGNGAVSEGAPAVGNTKILTENDNILDLIAQYQYKYDNDLEQSTIEGTVRRSLQKRLDDGAVNATNFGIDNNSPTLDQTELIQEAIYGLFLTTTPQDRVTLEFEPGTYKITGTIYLPSNVSISGSGKDKTIFNFDNSDEEAIVIAFINDSSTKDQINPSTTTFANQTKNILLTDFTITTNNKNAKAFDCNNVRDSEFHNIKILGSWVKTDGVISNSRAIDLRATSSVVTCQRNKFSDLFVQGFTYGIYSSADITNNIFKNNKFRILYRGVSFGETSGPTLIGPTNNSIISNHFELVSREGIIVIKGYGNVSRGNTFVDVGNDEGGPSNNKSSQIKFAVPGNSSMQDVFDRARNLARNNFDRKYISEIEGSAARQETMTTVTNLTTTATPAQALRLPLNELNSFRIDYIFQSTEYVQMRKGTLHIAVDRFNNNVQLVDEYEYTGEPGGEDKVIFTAGIGSSEDQKHLVIFYTNSNNLDINTFTYTITSLS